MRSEILETMMLLYTIFVMIGVITLAYLIASSPWLASN